MTSLTWTPARVTVAWRLPFAATLALILLILLLYRDTAVAMVDIWYRSETFTHAFIVPPIVAWLIWRKRAALAAIQPRAMPWMLLPMAGLALLWWLGHLVNVASATQLAMTAMVVAAVPLVLGWRVARALTFPLAFAFFAVPIGEFLTPTLMHWTAQALVAGLRLTGIPVYQEGQQLVIPSGRWAVVAACGGIRYLVATFMVGSLFAYLNYRSAKRRAIFVAVSIVLPVVANWVRAYMIVMLGHLSNNEIATGADHLVYGWVFYGVIILGLFFIGARWAEFDPLPADAVPPSPGVASAGPAEPAAWAPLLVAALALLVLQWPLWIQAGQRGSAAAIPLRYELPPALAGWQSGAAAAGDWKPFFATATLHLARRYQGPEGEVTVHVAYYRGQTGDVKMVSSNNMLIDPEDRRWILLKSGVAEATGPGATHSWRTATILAAEGQGQSSADRPQRTVWQTYWIGGRLAHGDIEAKLMQAWLAVRGEPDDSAVIHLVSALPDEAAAKRQLSAFVSQNFDLLQRSLMQARQNH